MSSGVYYIIGKGFIEADDSISGTRTGEDIESNNFSVMASSTYGPEVQKVAADTPLEDLIYLLKRDGGVFVKNFVSESDVDQAFSECRERLENDVEWQGSFFPSKPSMCRHTGDYHTNSRHRTDTESTGFIGFESYVCKDASHAPDLSADM